MGIDLLMDIGMFYVIWRFMWKKSRNKHMERVGRSNAMDFAYFIVFVIVFLASLLIIGTHMAVFGIFAPFYVIAAIIAAYAVTVRMTLFVPRGVDGKQLESGKVGEKYRIGENR